MRRGLFLAPFGEFSDPRRVAELASSAERAGWDGLFLWDHILADPGTPIADPWVTLAAVAVRTERLRLGAMVTPVARRRPWVLARQAATLDHVSGGRVVFGVGLGDDGWREFSAFGDPGSPALRAMALDEGLAIIRSLWAGTPVRHAGASYEVDCPAFLPRPLQTPIPTWAACRWPHRRPLRRAAALEGCFPIFGGGWPAPPPTPDQVGKVRSALLALGGSEDADLVVTHASWAQPHSARSALKGMEAAGATWWLEWLGPEGISPSRVEEVVAAGPPA
jgi:alkanesulfonate monooxygenase SsuD/methylene tetrahydromethanopterin reductase-like flavin-dependent oxidoreductase (luciferase family)